MDHQILPILDPVQVDRILLALQSQTFVDGKATAQGMARAVKYNQQAERTGELAELEQLVSSSLYANSLFQAFAVPRRIRPPLFSRYEPGMSYGDHVDSAIINDQGQLLRADLAVTLFLSPPESYDGGELIIRQGAGQVEIKLAPGDAVIYPADTLHQVAPVTRGVRMAAVTWVQTAVQDSRMRAILFDLFLATQQAEAGELPTLLLAKSYHNLVRITAEF